MEKKYDLVVAYRIYPGVSKVPPVHADNKYKLSALCLRSFVESFGNLKVKVIALLDDCPAEFTTLFKDIIPEEDLVIHEFKPKLGNFGTFARQIDELLTQQESELVMFAEDDYVYLPGALEHMVNFMKANPDADFACPYDHPDYYASLYHQYSSKVIYDSSRHWRTGASTTLTFMTRKSVLQKAQHTLRAYSDKNKDFCVWMALTKINVWNWWKPLFNIVSNRWMFGYFRRAWQYNWKQILFGDQYTLWVPLPTLATHMESDFLAPLVQWENYFTQYDNGKRE